MLYIVPDGELPKEFSDLLSQDFELEVYNNEKDAFKALDDDYERYSAILVDMKLTRQSDYEILSLLSTDKIFASIPVIALCDHVPEPEDMDVFEKGLLPLI